MQNIQVIKEIGVKMFLYYFLIQIVMCSVDYLDIYWDWLVFVDVSDGFFFQYV